MVRLLHLRRAGGLFAKYFFPPGNDNLALLAGLAMFWFGFILRPLGAIFFGHLGDLIGRKFTFMLTLGMMGLATFLVGCIPSYETWGIAAPILILLMRAMQGLALGGEYGGAATYIAEHAPDGRRGLYTSWIQLIRIDAVHRVSRQPAGLAGRRLEEGRLVVGNRCPPKNRNIPDESTILPP
jgi:MFS family permease